MMQQNPSHAAQQSPFPAASADAAVSADGADGTLPFSLDPYTAKQMAALQATSIAKAANRSAPGGTSVPYFGGLLTHQSHPTRRPDLPTQGLQPSHLGVPLDLPQPQLQSNPPMAHPNPALIQQQLIQGQQKRRQFLNGLANLHMRANPLPPELVGVPWPPGYDPAQSPWKILDISRTELGHFRMAGKEVDLYKLWALVLQAGGFAKVEQQGLWPSVLRQFDLPDQFPEPSPTGQQSVAYVLSRYYQLIIGPFEEAYRRNFRDQQARAAAMQANRMQPGMPQGAPGGAGAPDVMPGPSQLNPGQGMAGDSSNMNMGGMGQSIQLNPSQPLDSAGGVAGLGQMSPQNPSHTPQIAQHASNAGMNHLGMSASSTSLLGGSILSQQSTMLQLSAGGTSQDMNGADVDEGRKRKMRESEEVDPKRVRQKTAGSDTSDMRASVGLDRSSVPPSGMLNGHTTPAAAPRPIRQPSRRKIEYVPLSREIDTTGGRDLDAVQKEAARAGHRPLKDMNEWGQVDVEALTMSLRSRISTELSYALTTFTMLTLMRYPHKELGFPIVQAPDLLEEALDLLEDVGFDGAEDDVQADTDSTSPIKTYRELVNALVEDGSRPFAGLQPKHGSKDPDIGPRPRRGDTIVAVMNILRNLSLMPDNHEYMAKHERLLSIVLRLCSLASPEPNALPTPASPALSLQDLLTARKDTIHILVNIAGFVAFSSHSVSKTGALDARRAFDLLSSFLTDPVEAVSPLACIMLSGVQPAMHHPPKPPALADTTLEVFTRLFQPDDNRRMLSESVPQEWLWTMVEALVHRLPVSDNDFQVVMRDVWLGYVEKILMAIYSLAFLAPPQLKKQIKTDRRLAFTKVLLRLVKKFTIYSPPETRMYFTISVRRAVEAMKLIDDAQDSFDTSQSTSPTLMFGMGYGEHGENRSETGMGLLSGYQDEITWGLMMQREIAADDLMFTELDSLVRVDKLVPAFSA